MQWLKDFTNEILGPISVVIGIITIFPVLWTWWEVTFGRKRRHKEWFKEARRLPGERPGILIMDLLEKGDIATSVENYRQNDDRLRSIPAGRVFTVSREKHLTPTDVPELARDIRHIASDIIRAGIDTLHVFYAGPVVPMALIGAEFANSCQLMLYQHNRGNYENWGPLRHSLE